MRKWKFSNGSQYADWLDNECGNCAYFEEDANGQFKCPIAESTSVAYIIGNEEPVPDELVELEGCYHCYRCTKKVLKTAKEIVECHIEEEV